MTRRFDELRTEAAEYVADQQAKAEFDEEHRLAPEPEGNPEFDAAEIVQALKGPRREQRIATPALNPPVSATQALSQTAAAIDATTGPAVGELTGPIEQVASLLAEIGGTSPGGGDTGRVEERPIVIAVDAVQDRWVLTWRSPGDRFGRDATVPHMGRDRSTALRELATTIEGAARATERTFVAVSESAGLNTNELAALATATGSVVVRLVPGSEVRWEHHQLESAVAEPAPVVAVAPKPALKPVPTDQQEWLTSVPDRLNTDLTAETIEAWNGSEVAIHRNQRAPFTGEVYTSLTGTVEVDGRTLELEVVWPGVPGVTVPLKELRFAAE